MQCDELVVDLFAGGGGTGTGIERALGRSADVAINHDPVAVAMHARNHPRTRHYCESVFVVDPREACGARPVGLLWLSPDCTHFSKTKGGKPRDKKIRGLAWVGVKWVRAVRPRVVILENVEEFEDWGPIDDAGMPIKARAGEEFRQFVATFRRLGYVVEWRNLVAADYGAPTSRKRLFLVARRDGLPIVWPTPTHGPGRIPYRTAAEIIDWSIPCPSIFGRSRPLVDKTLQRIAFGVHRYVLGTDRPYLIGNDNGIFAPGLVQSGYGERVGQTPRALDIETPIGTMVAGGIKHRIVASLITKHFGGVVGHDMRRPLGTVTARDHHALTTATLLDGGREADVRALLERFPAERRYPRSLFGHGLEIGDIGSRMLRPRECFNAQGFPADYVIDIEIDGKPITGEMQTHLAGNSVPPAFACALVQSNVLQQAEAA
jgi:DNA (cytosine-5)-methyltransferase 1